MESESCRGGRAAPLRCRLGSEDPEGRPRDEVALKVEGVVDGSMHAHETLGAADLNRCILCSRRRTTWCEFSARLFLRSPCSW